MAKTFFFKFGTGDPRPYTGISPTFLIFVDQNGSTLSPPSITEDLVGSGFYKFSYTPTLGIAFLIDGATTLLDSVSRYVSGALDPVLLVDQQLSGNGSSFIPVAAAIGTNSDSYGSTSADPTTLFGYLKRSLEFNEGNATYTKSSGTWDIYSRGSSTLLIEKTLSDSSVSTTKS